MDERLKTEFVSTMESLESLQVHINELKEMMDQLRLKIVSIEDRLREVQATPPCSENWKERK